MYEVKGAKDRAATRIDSVRDLVRIPRRSRANKLRHRNTVRGHRGPLLHSRRFQGSLTREHTRGQWSTEQDSVLGIKSGLSDTDVNSRVIYRGRSESEAGYERRNSKRS
jgi:hypothetical protein